MSPQFTTANGRGNSNPFPNVSSVGNPFQAIGFGILLLFLFILISRAFDVVGTSFQIPFATSVLVFAAAVFSGGVLRVPKHPIGKFLLGFTVWMAVGLPFSFWRSGSLDTFQSWLKSFLVYVCIISLVATFEQTVRAIKVLGLAVLVLAVLALYLGNTDSGRLFLSEGKFQNPNDLAQMMLIGLPFLWLMVKDSTQNLLFKIPPLLLSVLLFYVLLKTGSRGGLIGFFAMLLFLFARSSMGGRIALIMTTLGLVVITLIAVPASLRSRFTTLMSSDAEDYSDMTDSATSSAESRKILLMRSISMTIHNPLFGVGVGMFPEVVEDDLRKLGQRTIYLVSHNSYTQVSSEMGIPGLILFCGILIACFRATGRVVKAAQQRRGPRWRNVEDTAVCLRMSLVAFSVTAMFSSIAYQTLMPTLAGLCAVLSVSIKEELDSEKPQTPAVAPPARVFPTRPAQAAARMQHPDWQRT